jgi:3-oxoacyl-[acyl-carrier protein] reductase
MTADGGGRIVNVASIAAFTGYSGLSVYVAAKSSMIGFTRSLAYEVGRMDVNVNAVAPGFKGTEMIRCMDSERREKLARRSSLRRFRGVEDVADPIGYLLGYKARNVTASVLIVDAGAAA